jgi:hypothetical protein
MEEEFKPAGAKMVGVARIELATLAMSTQRGAPEDCNFNRLKSIYGQDRANGSPESIQGSSGIT